MLLLSTPTTSFIAGAEGLKGPNISQIKSPAIQPVTPGMSPSLPLIPPTPKQCEMQKMREIQKLVNAQIAAMEVIN